MKLLQIPHDAVVIDKVWPVVAPFLSKAAEHSRGTHSVECDRQRVKANAAQLWVIVLDEKPHTVVAAGITSITEYPNGKRAVMIESLGGENMADWFSLKDEIEQWALQNGCDLAFCWARRAWAKRLPDYHLSCYILAKELRQ